MNKTRVLTTTALLIALAVVIREISDLSPTTLVYGVRVKLDAIFTLMVPILFGPTYGGIAGGIMDGISYFIGASASKPWLWQLTATTILSGITVGLLYKIKVSKNAFLQILFAVGISTIIFTTIDTFSLQSIYGKGFINMLPIRLGINIIVAIFNSYIMSILIKFAIKGK